MHWSRDVQIGSVIIVLHAPSDKEVETVDEILGYAAQPGTLLHLNFLCMINTDKRVRVCSIPSIHYFRRHLFDVYDLSSRPNSWKQESNGVPINLLVGWKCFGHGYQSQWLHACKKQIQADRRSWSPS